MQSHTRYSYVDNSVLTVQLPEHCTCKTKHHFPYTIVLAPIWTKRVPWKWIQFTWKRNDSNHEFHLDTETVDNQLVSSKYSYYKSNFKKINHQPTGWWLLTNPFLWWLGTFCDYGVTITMLCNYYHRPAQPVRPVRPWSYRFSYSTIGISFKKLARKSADRNWRLQIATLCFTPPIHYALNSSLMLKVAVALL